MIHGHNKHTYLHTMKYNMNTLRTCPAEVFNCQLFCIFYVPFNAFIGYDSHNYE